MIIREVATHVEDLEHEFSGSLQHGECTVCGQGVFDPRHTTASLREAASAREVLPRVFGIGPIRSRL